MANKRDGSDRKMSDLSPAFTVTIPKGCSGEEGVAGKEARPIEVVTASGEYQNPEYCHARYPGGRHYCHAALPHVILYQHRQKTITLSHSYAERFTVCNDVRVCTSICAVACVFLLASSAACLHYSTFRIVVDTYHVSFTQMVTIHCVFFFFF